ncbi:hypothetical protein B0T14DRAFT_531382 [Immersiella caudata]|uniref:Uncharacterized protein n=1 Tax=Immersiella caudata TaxID=314043 RepID=A0AA39U6H3_9PEZI|nr:hypothetical protein B0T14DRAFT_531382 [Immersiella caudata]
MTGPSPISSSVAAARDLVETIAVEHGHLTDEVYSKMDPATRRLVKEAFGKKDSLIGSSIITLAKNLYSHDVRFIFELLQNADDNLFERAKKSGHEPYLVFWVFQDRIVVDCNEDGFEEANLRAICSVGQSSKVGREGYIGEKGIGFKSVFKVAWKVHVQSRDYSFCFKHRPGDSGMGMISPEWHPAEALPEPMTRMTFFLHDSGDGSIQAAQSEHIEHEFEQLQPSMMLFLKKIRRIEVRFFDSKERETKSSIMTRSACNRPNRAVLEKVRARVGDGGKRWITTSKSYYHLTKGKATGLAKNENRTYSAAEEASQAYSTAEIVLAFPLDELSVPIDKPQNIFAFLPMRHVGFNFLIHSDFVTMANREDIVTSSLRNQGIRKHIASTFVSAVKQMCGHPKLRFQWMRFLPPPTGSHVNDGFWRGFVDLLKQQLLGAEIMVPRLVGPQRTTKQVKQFPSTPIFRDQHREPLFDDLEGRAALYISKCYKVADLRLLHPYGLDPLSVQDILDRVSADLGRATSKMRSSTTDADWHSRVAKVLKYCFTLNDLFISDSIQTMPLLPLGNGRWVSLRTGQPPVYFPATSNNTTIPPGLPIQLICPNAAMHPDRKKLFLTLGVKIATDNHIRSIVLEEYQKRWPSQQESIAWIRFLYLTRLEKTESADDYTAVSILSSTMESIQPFRKDVYFPDDKSEYGAAKLGLDVNFLHPDYLKDPPMRSGERVAAADELWRKWLHDMAWIRKRLKLVASDGSAISHEALHVAHHLPGMFLGLLHHLWPYEGGTVQQSEALRTKFQELEVLCDGGKKHRLDKTIFPTSHLKALASRFTRTDEHLPFVDLQQTRWDGKISGWEFLDTLGVVSDDNLAFYLDILRCIVTRTTDASELRDPSRLLDLYQAIHGKCIASPNLEQARELIRSEFHKIEGIYVPRTQRGDALFDWESPNHCLLGAPVDLGHKEPIDTLYDKVFGGAVASTGLATVKHFFRDTLAIPRLSWRDYVAELEFLRSLEHSDFALIGAQYKRLKAARLNVGDTKELRKLFRDNELIFFRGDEDYTWYGTGECLWSSGTGVQGLVNLAQLYDHDLETFFVESLQVTRLTAQLIYDELLTLSDKQGTIETVQHVKRQLLAFSSLLQEETLSQAPAPSPLVEKPILPIRQTNGKVLLLPASAGFTIVDRAGPMAQFRDVVKTLDFTMEEVHELELFIRWAGLQNLYLSQMVEEVPDVGSGKKFRVSEPRYDLRYKAHGLVRVAKYFRSPRFQGNGQALYDLLRDSETWETDDISARLSLTVNGKTHSIKLKQGDVYMSGEDTSPLKIFIPHEETAQDVCIQQTLPQKFVKWLMDPLDESRVPVNDRAVGIVKGLLNARLRSIPSILTQEGIHEIELEDRDDAAPDAVVTTVAPPQTPSGSGSGFSSPGTPDRVFTPVPSADFETPLTDPFSSPSPNLFPRANPAPSRPLFSLEQRSVREPQTAAGVELYQQLLGHMIQAGKQVRFPDQGVFGVSQLTEALNGVGGSNLSTDFSSSNFSTFQLGAAGELFVFEILKSLASVSLPGFSWPNWTSNIKQQVKIHPDYETMVSWGGGVEVSDLQYSDTSGLFTALLIEKGHLSSAKWAGKRPHYYLEVKSTPRSCNEPFYMSGSQYKKVKFLRNPSFAALGTYSSCCR